MYRRILAPHDGSARAARIMTHAEEWAHRFETEVILLQRVEPESLYFGPHGSVPESAHEPYTAADPGCGNLFQGEFREKGI